MAEVFFCQLIYNQITICTIVLIICVLNKYIFVTEIMKSFKGILSRSGIYSKLLLFFGVTVFFTLFALLIWKIMTPENSTDIASLKILQLFQSIGMFVTPPFVVAYLWSKNPIDYLHLTKKTHWIDAMVIIIFMIIIIPFVNFLGAVNQQLVLPKAFSELEALMKASELQAAQLTQSMLNVSNVQGLVFNIILIALLPGLGEELFFRGALQRVFQEWKGPIVAIWITAFIFSAIHFQFYGFLPRMLLGAFLGYLFYWSGNLWLPILAHFINNFIAVIFYYFTNKGFILPNIDTAGSKRTGSGSQGK
jgi:membrane protease YdiL (CAAX protease family)